MVLIFAAAAGENRFAGLTGVCPRFCFGQISLTSSGAFRSSAEDFLFAAALSLYPIRPPPISSTRPLDMADPSPTPPCLRVKKRSARLKRKICRGFAWVADAVDLKDTFGVKQWMT